VVTNPEGEAPALCPACDVPMVRVIDTGPGWGGVVERHDEQAARLDRIRRDALRRLKRAVIRSGSCSAPIRGASRGPLEQHHPGRTSGSENFLSRPTLGAEVRANAFNGHDPVAPIRRAVRLDRATASGSRSMVAWLIDWIMSTRPHAQGTVTANTFTQLQTKTWAAIRGGRSSASPGTGSSSTDESDVPSGVSRSRGSARSRVEGEQLRSVRRPARGDSTSFYILDEASRFPTRSARSWRAG
jgi:hypothetical protein